MSRDEATLVHVIDEAVTAVWREVDWHRGETIYAHADRIKACVDRVIAPKFPNPTKAERDLLYLEGICAFLQGNQVAGPSTTNKGFIDVGSNVFSVLSDAGSVGFPKRSLEEACRDTANERNRMIKADNMRFADQRLEGACGDSADTTVLMADHLGVYSELAGGIVRGRPEERQMNVPAVGMPGRAEYPQNHAWSVHLLGLQFKKGPAGINLFDVNQYKSGVWVYTDPFWAQINRNRPPKGQIHWHFVCAWKPAMVELFRLTHIEDMSSTSTWLKQNIAPWNSKRYLTEEQVIAIGVPQLVPNLEASLAYNRSLGY